MSLRPDHVEAARLGLQAAVLGRTRPVTVDSGQKQAAGTWVSGRARYTRARKARQWSRAKVKWEMSGNFAPIP